MCMDTSPYVLETLHLLRFMGIDLFPFNQIALQHGVTQGDTSEMYFRNERRHGTGYLKKINF